MKTNVEENKNDETPEWLKRCLECTHAYKRKNDDDEMLCRCRKGCGFKKAKASPHNNI